MNDVSGTAARTSYWRVWGIEDGDVRVARDRDGRPEHLEQADGGRMVWRSHRQGAVIPIIGLTEFIQWLDQGGV